MSNLSTKALNFLKEKERASNIVERNIILEVFKNNNAPVFEPLIEFQQDYGGYIIYSGLVPVKYSLIKGEGGYPNNSEFAYIEFEESSNETFSYLFDCTLTETQLFGSLDENGCYYESDKLLASSFGKIVEEMAIFDDLDKKGGFKIVKWHQKINESEKLIEVLKLDEIREASDKYVNWFTNGSVYQKQWQGLTTLIVAESDPVIKELSLL